MKKRLLEADTTKWKYPSAMLNFEANKQEMEKRLRKYLLVVLGKPTHIHN